MGKRPRGAKPGASKKQKIKKRPGETFYKNEKDFEHFAVEEDPNEFIRNIAEKQPIKPLKLKKKQQKIINEDKESSDEGVQESAYSKLVISDIHFLTCLAIFSYNETCFQAQENTGKDKKRTTRR